MRTMVVVRSRFVALLLTGLVALGAAAALACATRTSEPTRELPPAERVAEGWDLVLHFGGLAELLDDPRDAGLARALEQLDERMVEVAAELGQGQPPPGSIELVTALVASPWTLRVDLGPGTEASMPVSVRADLRIQAGSAERATDLARRLRDFAQLFGLSSTSSVDDPELREIETPAGSFFFGAHARDGSVHLAFGAPASDSVRLEAFGLPRGVAPTLALELELGGLLELLQGFLAGAGPQVAPVRSQLEAMGLFGGPALGFTFAAGDDETRAHYVSRVRNWVPFARRTGALAEGALVPAALELVPLDATLAWLWHSEPAAGLRSLDALGPEAAAAVLAPLREKLGVDLGDDVLAPLGTDGGFFFSDTTGGGGLASGVLFLSLDDEARIAATLERLAQKLEEHAAELEGHVRVQRFQRDDVRGYALAFPGLPLPLEPALALHDGHLFAAASRGALEAALQHARNRGPSLAEHVALRLAGRGAFADLSGLVFADTPRLVRDGYGMLTLLGAALANGVRSPKDAAREPGLVLPSYPELVARSRATLLLSRLAGDDLVTSGTGDRSVLAHAAATLGWLPTMVLGTAFAWGLPVGVASASSVLTEGHQIDAGDEAAEWAELERALGEMAEELDELESEEPPAEPEDE
jgi:hypothetical protein